MFALGFAISQGGIAARTTTRMQGFEVKGRKEITANLPNCVTCHRYRSELNLYVEIGRRMPLPRFTAIVVAFYMIRKIRSHLFFSFYFKTLHSSWGSSSDATLWDSKSKCKHKAFDCLKFKLFHDGGVLVWTRILRLLPHEFAPNFLFITRF